MNYDYKKAIPLSYTFSKTDTEKASFYAQEKTYARNSSIFMEGDDGDEFYIIVSGIVEINRCQNGRKLVLATLQPGDFFGEMVLFEEGEVRSANAEILVKASILVFKRLDLLSFLESYPDVTFQLLTSLAKRLQKINELVYDMTFLNMRCRIYKQILHLASEYGVWLDGTVIINLPLTHQQIANRVGCTREMVTKVLIELQSDNVIDVIKKKIILNQPQQLLDKIGSIS